MNIKMYEVMIKNTILKLSDKDYIDVRDKVFEYIRQENKRRGL
jgi:hypothetical protein